MPWGLRPRDPQGLVGIISSLIMHWWAFFILVHLLVQDCMQCVNYGNVFMSLYRLSKIRHILSLHIFCHATDDVRFFVAILGPLSHLPDIQVNNFCP